MSLHGTDITHYSNAHANAHHVYSPIPVAEPASVWQFLQHFTSVHCDDTDDIKPMTDFNLHTAVCALTTARSCRMPCANALEDSIRNMCKTGCDSAMEVYAYAYIHGPDDIAKAAAIQLLSYSASELVHCPASRIISGYSVLCLGKYNSNVMQKILQLFHHVNGIDLVSPEMGHYIVQNGPVECQGGHDDMHRGIVVRQWWIIACQLAWKYISIVPLSRSVFNKQFIESILERTSCPCCRTMLIHSWEDICSVVRSRMSELAETVNFVML